MKLSWAGMIAVVCSVPLSAATVTLSQAGILALDWRESVHSTSILSATPRADGVEYEVAFASNRDPSVELVSSVSGGKGAFVGLPWKSGDSFALRFTLLSSAPGPEAYVSAGALISIRDMAAQAPVRLGGNRPQTGPGGAANIHHDRERRRTCPPAAGTPVRDIQLACHPNRDGTERTQTP